MKKLFISAFSLFSLLALLHWLGIRGFYYSVPLYDKSLHFLFGILVSMIVFLFFAKLGILRRVKNKEILYFGLGFGITAIIGAGWELFEFFFCPYLQWGRHDTVFDLVWMTAGFFLTTLIIYRLQSKKRFI